MWSPDVGETDQEDYIISIFCSVENLNDEKLEERVNVTDNHFVSDFFRLNQESSGFEIAAELSFQDGEFIFDDLPTARLS